jgi:hypothetical protein
VEQPAILNLGIRVDSFMIETTEGRCRSNAVKTMAVVKDAKFHLFKKLAILAIVG